MLTETDVREVTPTVRTSSEAPPFESGYEPHESSPTQQSVITSVEVSTEVRRAATEWNVPFVGQNEVAEVVKEMIEGAMSRGMPRLLVLEGPRGSGKTRLLTYASEVAARTSWDVRVLYAACRVRGSGDGAYAPFSRLLLDRFGIEPSCAPATARARIASSLSQLMAPSDTQKTWDLTRILCHTAGIPETGSIIAGGLATSPNELQQKIGEGLSQLFEADAKRRPIVLMLDDMHYAEPYAWDLVAATQRAHAPIAVLVAGHAPFTEHVAEQVSLAHGDRLSIPPLSEAAVSTILHTLLGIPAPDAFVSEMTQRSAGNPSTLRELIHGLAERGLFVRQPGGFGVDLRILQEERPPAKSQDAVRARLSRLSDLERQTLERAAIVGELFWDGAVVAITRTERLRDSVDEDEEPWGDQADERRVIDTLAGLEEKGFIESTGASDYPSSREFTFTHSATRPMLYRGIPRKVRASRHAIVARWLSVVGEARRDRVAAMVAPHLLRAGLQGHAGRAYLEAASYERAKMRTTMALRYTRRALPLIDADDICRKIDALHEHGSLLTTVGRYDEAIDAFSRMLRLAWSVGAQGKGGAALNRMARVYRQRGEDSEAIRLLESALSLFRSASDLRGVGSTLDDLAQVLRARGEIDAAWNAATEALQIRRRNGDERGEAVSLTTLGAIELGRGRLDASEDCFAKALQIRNQIGDQEGATQSRTALGVLAFERGDCNTALSSWLEALEQVRAMSDRQSETFLLERMGEALLAEAQFESASECLERAKDLAWKLGDRRAIANVERNLGLLALRKGQGNAGAILQNALTLAHSYGGKEMIGLAHRAVGQLRAQTIFDAEGSSDAEEAESFFCTSIEIFRAIGNEKEAARSLAELGFHLVERGQTIPARERLAEARTMMQRMKLAELAKVEQVLSQIS